jgi:hypothetical protein
LKLSFLNFFRDTEDEEEDFEEDTDIPLIGRTGYLLLARELGYRLCEAQIGVHMEGKDWVELHKLNIDLLIKVSKEEGQKSNYKFVTKQDLGEEFKKEINLKQRVQTGQEQFLSTPEKSKIFDNGDNGDGPLIGKTKKDKDDGRSGFFDFFK